MPTGDDEDFLRPVRVGLVQKVQEIGDRANGYDTLVAKVMKSLDKHLILRAMDVHVQPRYIIIIFIMLRSFISFHVLIINFHLLLIQLELVIANLDFVKVIKSYSTSIAILLGFFRRET